MVVSFTGYTVSADVAIWPVYSPVKSTRIGHYQVSWLPHRHAFAHFDHLYELTQTAGGCCISCGYSTEEAMQMAKEALQLYLEDMNEVNIPQASSKETLEKNIKPNQKVIDIEI